LLYKISKVLTILLKHEECCNLLVTLIFVPKANGHFEFFNPALAAGGKLFALSLTL
jgi:hypothetical protein